MPAQPAPQVSLPEDPNLQVGRLIKLVFYSLLRGVDARMQPLELTAMQWEPLLMLALGRADTVAALVRLTNRVYVADQLYTYAVRLATATRDHKQVRVGVSPRGVIALSRAAQAYALMDGRPYVVPEDVKTLVEPVFAHRLLLAPDATMRGVTATEVLHAVVESVAAPAPTRS